MSDVVFEQWPLPEKGSIVIGVGGGSGSGKTTLVDAVVDQVMSGVAVIQHDAYYRHRPELSLSERAAVNYDHPESFETELLVEHLGELQADRSFEKPIYDYVTHLRADETETVQPEAVIFLEGILVLVEEPLRSAIDLKVFVDTDHDVRLLRRIHRDVKQRGRSEESVRDQWERTVQPMYLEFVEPSRRYADLIIPGGYSPAAAGVLKGLVSSVAG